MSKTGTSTVAKASSLLSVHQAAVRTGMSEAAIRDRIKRGVIPFQKIGARVYLPADQLLKFEQLLTTATITAEQAIENLRRRKV